MSVEALRTAQITRLEKAMQAHDDKDDRRFGALESQTAHMAGSLDVLVGNQASLMTALGVRENEPDRTHRPVAMMGQRELMWKFLGAAGGLLLCYKAVLTIFPFAVGALKAVAHLQ